MPMPVSETLNSSQSRPSLVEPSGASVIVPCLVNLAALLNRLNRLACRSDRSASRPDPERSPPQRVGVLGHQRLDHRLDLGEHCGTSNSSTRTSIMPASILDRSRMLLIRLSRCRPAPWIFSRSGKMVPG